MSMTNWRLSFTVQFYLFTWDAITMLHSISIPQEIEIQTYIDRYLQPSPYFPEILHMILLQIWKKYIQINGDPLGHLRGKTMIKISHTLFTFVKIWIRRFVFKYTNQDQQLLWFVAQVLSEPAPQTLM